MAEQIATEPMSEAKLRQLYNRLREYQRQIQKDNPLAAEIIGKIAQWAKDEIP